MPLLIRMFTIALGFFAGCLAAGLSYVFLAKLVVPEDFGSLGELELTVTLVVGVLGVSSLFARAVLLPAMAIIAAFEFFKLRDWLSHALAGGVLALALTSLPLLRSGASAETAEFDPVAMIAIRVACAIIGATVYWLVTGRSAGRWLPSERQTGFTSPDSGAGQ
ncbi:hypothetical protein [uncultured Hoeflea sp.]|uniref:hypothetical protein n=1 Tax=uncultured Hoeflea sp. TaxID=538666 RepID=UPI00261059E1|nr:hypothetical protein [uncultured Hoeflea sp.]